MDPREKQALHEARLSGAVEKLLQHRDGIYFLRWLVLESGTLEARYPADYGQAAFREGQRATGAAVLALIVGCGGADKFFAEDARHG